MASDDRIKRSLGEMNDFVLYMFEEDLAMIEKWAAEPLMRTSQGGLVGLWTNSRNPVVHLVLVDNKPADDYLLIECMMYKDNRAKSMFCHIGHWSFEKPSEGYYQDIMARISSTAPRLVFLEVEQKSDELLFHPMLLTKEETLYGRIDPLQGQNPFRLPDEPSNSPAGNEKMAEEKPKESDVVDSRNSQGSTTFASAVKQDSHSKVPDSTQESQQKQTNNTPFPSQYGGKDVSTCTKTNQWYLSDHGQKQLQEISEKLQEFINEKPKISRDNDTHNIMILFSFEDKSYVISFPPNFPNLQAELYYLTRTRNDRSCADSSQVKSKDPIKLVEEIIDIVSKHR